MKNLDEDLLLFTNRFLDQKEYWLKKLGGRPAAFEFITETGEAAAEGMLSEEIIFPEALSQRILGISSRSGITTYVILEAALKTLLYKYTGQRDITVFSPVNSSMRTEETINSLVPLYDELDGGFAFKQLLGICSKTIVQAYENQDFPSAKIAEHLVNERLLAANQQLSNLVCSLANIHGGELAVPANAIHFTFEFKDAVTGSILYSPTLLSRQYAAQLARHYVTLLAHALKDVAITLDEISCLSPEESLTLAKGFSDNTVAFDADRLLHHYVEHFAKQSPGKTALRFAGKELSYEAVNASANRLARHLAAKGVKPGHTVALLMHRSDQMFIAILAAWKAGAAYIPIDPAYPHNRITEILNDSQTPTLITQSQHLTADLRKAFTGAAVELDAEAGSISAMDGTDLGLTIQSGNLAYVIYTSGSTGRPKGAMVEFAGMMNHIHAKVNALGLNADGIVAQNASHTFDISVWQFFAAMVTGAQTVIYPNELVLTVDGFVEQLAGDKVSILEVVPSYLTVLIESAEAGAHTLPALEYLLVTGEEIRPNLANRWLQRFASIPLVNAYGPTEASDDITHYFIRKPVSSARVPVGEPVQNFRIYIVDGQAKLCPIGVKGEIWVSGIGVGRGYLNNPGLTEKVFINDPFSEKPVRLYKTGDIGRYLHDGNIEFFGRRDHQVKIRGYRIELGEIEAAIIRTGNIKEAVVIVKEESGSQSLNAFITVQDGSVTPAAVTQALAAQLPEYMVPANISVLRELPLTPNGKVDRSMLSHTNVAESSLAVNFSKPDTEVERKLAGIWIEVLSLSDVGVNDNFFQLGGHSVAAIQVVSRVKKHLGAELALVDLFENPTIRRIAQIVEQKLQATGSESATAQIPVKAAKPHYELSPLQYPEWFLLKFNPESTFYNVGMLLQFKGDLNVKALFGSLNTVITRHDSFRYSFIEKDGRPYTVGHENALLEEDDFLVDLSGEERQEEIIFELIRKNFNTTIRLDVAPIGTFKLIKLNAQDHVFIFETNHIVWDQISTFNFAKELQTGYNQLSRNEAVNLPPLRINYTDYAEWINGLITSGKLEKQRQYWLNEYSDLPEPLNLPVDFPRPPIQTFNGHSISSYIDMGLKAEIESFCRNNNTTLQIFLVSALNLLLYRTTGQDDFVVGTPIANRTHEDLEGLIGLFSAALPLRCRVAGDITFEQLLQSTRETSIQAYDNSLYPFNKVIEELRPNLDFSRSKVISVFFGVQNEETELEEMAFRFDGLEVGFFEREGLEEISQGTSVFDFTLQIDHTVKYMKFGLRYNTDLFKESTARRFLDRFTSLVKQGLQNPATKLSAFDLLLPEEKEVLQNVVSNPANYAIPDCGIHNIIERTAAQYPAETAVIWQDKHYSYSTLDQDANRMAHYLLRNGLKSGERVGLLLPRSYDMLAVLLGILKAGGVYVPFSKDIPLSRMKEIREDAGISRMVTMSAWLGSDLGQLFEHITDLDASRAAIAQEPATSPQISVHAESPAYILFTSGSTGRPKGIQIYHRGVINLVESSQRDFNLKQEGGVLFNTTLIFDSSILDFFWPLSVGARIVIHEEEKGKDIALIAERINKYKLSVIQFVPLMLEAFVNAKAKGETGGLPSLEIVNVGGSILNTSLRNAFYRNFSCRLINNYGPTETTVDVTRFDCAAGVDTDIVPIGKPILNTNLYVLDAFMNICPPAVMGELYISSAGNASGYLNNEQQSRQSFVPNVFNDAHSTLLYRTGDRACYREDGNLVVYGRMDNQVKVNGNRVEIDEIENKLLSHPLIHNAAVLLRKDKDNYESLVSFIELKPEVNTIQHAGNRYRCYTLEQSPTLLELFLAHAGNDVELWNEVAAFFPQWQLCLLNDNEEVMAACCAFPSQPAGDIPAGLLAKLKGRAGESAANAGSLFVLAISASTGLKEQVLSACCALAEGQLNTIVLQEGEKLRHLAIELSTASEKPAFPDDRKIKDYLKEYLPAYMIPSRIVFLNQVALLPSGKNNKAFLSALNIHPGRKLNSRPVNNLQARLLELFAEITGAGPETGIFDNFFEIGGHSINALRLVARIEKLYAIKIPIAHLFVNATVSAIAKYIQSNTAAEAAPHIELLNKGTLGNIVALPSITSSPMDFRELARVLDQYNFYALDLGLLNKYGSINGHIDEIVSECTGIILGTKMSGSLIVVGYSAGAVLGHEIVKALEKAGKKVERFVVLDSDPNQNKGVYSEEKLITNEMLDDHLPPGFLDKIGGYDSEHLTSVRKFLVLDSCIVNKGKINAPIFLIQSENGGVKSQLGWKELSNDGVMVRKAKGKHYEIINKEFVHVNHQLLTESISLTDHQSYTHTITKDINIATKNIIEP